MRMTSERVFEAERAGAFAARFFAAHSRAEIVAVFERSLYLQAGRAFACLGDARIGDGPINVIVDDGGGLVGQSRVGEVITSSGGISAAPGWRLDFRRVDIWAPPAWPVPAGADALVESVERVVEIACSMLPCGGLLPLAIAGNGGNSLADAFEKLAAPRLARLESWLSASLSEQRAGEPPVDLLGLGPGLTPSGDDALCAVLLALSAFGSQPAAWALQHLASAIGRGSAEATTALSGQFLSAASEGQGSAVLHDFVGVLVGGERARIPAALEKLSRVGHSSGLDAAAGVILAVRALVTAGASVAASHHSTQSP